MEPYSDEWYDSWEEYTGYGIAPTAYGYPKKKKTKKRPKK